MDFISNGQIYDKIKKTSKFMMGEPGYVLNVDYTPQIRKSDIDNGSLIRYFGKKTNEELGEIIELNEQMFNKLSESSLYITIKIPWRICGKLEDTYAGTTRIYTGVVSANVLTTLDAEKRMKGILARLPDPLQYYQKE